MSSTLATSRERLAGGSFLLARPWLAIPWLATPWLATLLLAGCASTAGGGGAAAPARAAPVVVDLAVAPPPAATPAAPDAAADSDDASVDGAEVDDTGDASEGRLLGLIGTRGDSEALEGVLAGLTPVDPANPSGGFGGPGNIGGGRGRTPGPAPVVTATPSAAADGAIDAGEVRRVVMRTQIRARYCYAKGLERVPTLAGRVVVRAVVDANGHVKSSVVGSSTLRDAEVEQCLKDMSVRWIFTRAPGGATAVIAVPYTFAPPQAPPP